MAKQPAFQFYPGDWLRESGLHMCSTSTKGIWIDILSHMWGAKERGKIQGTKAGFCRLLGCIEQEFDLFLAENNEQDFARVTFCNEKVTVECRRMRREDTERKSNNDRQKRHRDKQDGENNAQCNALDNVKVTPPSSSSSSFSNKDKEYMLVFEKARQAYPGTVLGTQTEFDSFCKKHSDWREVLPLLTPAIKAQIASRNWLASADKFVPNWKHFKSWLYNRRWEEEAGGAGRKREPPKCGACGKPSNGEISGLHYCSQGCLKKQRGY